MSSTDEFNCGLCLRTFSSAASQKLHENSVHKKFRCKLCSGLFEDEKSLHAHLIDVHSKWQCNECDKSYKTKDSLRKHKDIHKKGPKKTMKGTQLICKTCHKKYDGKRALLSHISQVHKSMKEFQCEFCNKIFKSKGNLVQHHKIHKDKTVAAPIIVKCPLCQENLSINDSQSHVNSLHKKFKNQFCCNICQIKFPLLHFFKQHNLKVHSGVADILAEDKNEEYDKEVDILANMNKLEEEEEDDINECNMCHEQFDQLADLKRHLQDCAKLSVCNFCDKTFLSEEYLELHVTSHFNGQSSRSTSSKGSSSDQNVKQLKMMNIKETEKVKTTNPRKMKKFIKCFKCNKSFQLGKFSVHVRTCRRINTENDPPINSTLPNDKVTITEEEFNLLQKFRDLPKDEKQVISKEIQRVATNSVKK